MKRGVIGDSNIPPEPVDDVFHIKKRHCPKIPVTSRAFNRHPLGGAAWLVFLIASGDLLRQNALYERSAKHDCDCV